jgi:arginyl-tRNA synthetase
LSKYANQDLLRILLIEHGYSSVINLNLDEIIFENSSLFYIQYAYTRVWSILNKISYDKNSLDLELLNNGEEKKIITILVFWPELIENITNNLEVHLILMYAKNLSKILHSYCTNYTIIQDNIPLQNARLYLMEKCLLLLTDIMNILKITILEKM